MFRTLLITTVLAATFVTSVLPATDNLPAGVAPVRITVTANVDKDRRSPQIEQEDVLVKKGNQHLKVTEWVPARGERAGLELFVLIDDAATTSLGLHLNDLRGFILAQPASTSIAVGYARNAGVEIRQNFTTDHQLAAKALRLPVGSPGAYGSPYLSVVNLMKRWPDTPNRREVILISDGVDRARRAHTNFMTLDPDVDTAAFVAQRTGTTVHTIYFPGVGHWHRNFWRAMNGQNGLAKLSEASGGEAFSFGLQDPVSITPYLNDLQRILDNQYLLSFVPAPGKKASLHSVAVSTEVAGVDFNTADAVWVPAAK